MSEGDPIDARTPLPDLAARVAEVLRARGITAVLTGGAVASIYTGGEIHSWDLDFIAHAAQAEIDAAVGELGFKRQGGRHYEHPRTPYYLEFPAPPLAIGNRPVEEWARLETDVGVLELLTPTQAVMDRLAAWFHWQDRQGLEQAIEIAWSRPEEVDLETVRAWATEEESLEAHVVFMRRLSRRS